MAPQPGKVYRHYKGDYYLVLFVGEMSNGAFEGQPCVVYQSLNPRGGKKGPDTNPIRVRTLSVGGTCWNEPVLMPSGAFQRRFVQVDM